VNQSNPATVPVHVLSEFDLDPDTLERVTSGHINATWLATRRDGRRVVLQRVNPIFPPSVNADIEAVSRHLAARGLVTPRLLPPASGGLALVTDDGVWRVLTRIEGIAPETVESDAQAREAARLLGRFHAALVDLEREPGSARLGVHDLDRHLTTLRAALGEHAAHAEIGRVAPLAERVLELAARLPPLPPSTARIVHGDPKISNVLFEPASGAAVCLIDLDTLARMPVALELGDAFRSWCNPRAEDAPDSMLALERFAAAVAGYGEGAPGLLDAAEWRAVPAAVERIAVGLAARFCADALNERYFGWDETRFASASAHNQARTRGQLALAESVAAAREAMLGIVARESRRFG